jgi:dolichol-phosphate mannosyltransferase
MNFSIVLAVLNEEKNIRPLITSIKKKLKDISYELIFVDDSSSDNTAKEIKKFLKNNIKYYLRKNKKDIAQSIIMGIQKSKYNNIIIMDSDLQHNPKYLPIMIKKYEKNRADFVVGVRNFEKNKGLSKIRLLGSKVLCYIYNFFLGYKVSDPMTGFSIFKKKIFKKYYSKMYGKGWKLLADLIYNKESFKIIELKINFDKRLYHYSKINFSVLLNVIGLFIYKFYLLKIRRG